MANEGLDFRITWSCLKGYLLDSRLSPLDSDRHHGPLAESVIRCRLGKNAGDAGSISMRGREVVARCR